MLCLLSTRIVRGLNRCSSYRSRFLAPPHQAQRTRAGKRPASDEDASGDDSAESSYAASSSGDSEGASEQEASEQKEQTQQPVKAHGKKGTAAAAGKKAPAAKAKSTTPKAQPTKRGNKKRQQLEFTDAELKACIAVLTKGRARIWPADIQVQWSWRWVGWG